MTGAAACVRPGLAPGYQGQLFGPAVEAGPCWWRVVDAAGTDATADPSLHAGAPSADARPANTPYRMVWDRFDDGFSTTGPSAKWSYFGAGPYVGNDGVETTGQHGLRVVAGGTNAARRQSAPGGARSSAMCCDPGRGFGK